MRNFQENYMESFSMRPLKQTPGLCLTCINAENCIYRKRRGTDAIYCEMFDNGVYPNGQGKNKAVSISALAPEKVENTQYKGLCVNCAHRETCRLARFEGGIWHCDEYE